MRGRERPVQGCGEWAAERLPQAAQLASGRQLRPGWNETKGNPSEPQSRPQREPRGGRGGDDARDPHQEEELGGRSMPLSPEQAAGGHGIGAAAGRPMPPSRPLGRPSCERGLARTA